MPAKTDNDVKKLWFYRTRQHLQALLTGLVTEGLDFRHIFAAVFCGVFVGVVPIYGLQMLTAIFLASLFRLNKPITLGATFINNPFFQPFLVFSSIQLGHFMRKGEFAHLASLRPGAIDLKGEFVNWVAGSLVLGLVLGAVIAFFAAVIVSWTLSRKKQPADLREAERFVNLLFRQSPQYAKGFVRWKLRLDKIFGQLLLADDYQGPLVDLGCGYGIASAIIAFRHPGMLLMGCDLDANRIQVGNQALRSLNAQLSVHDIRSFGFSEAGLILIMDVLQYLNASDQQALIKRCCTALQPNGSLIFRVPDREKGLLSKLTMILDKIIFRSAGNRERPIVLSIKEYENILQNADMSVQKQRMTGRLPLAHVLFIAKKTCMQCNRIS